MIKTIFFDVDGTLLSHTSTEVLESTRIALEKLKEKNIKRVLATGRHMLELADLPVKNIIFDGYITLNGQLCLDNSKNVIFENPIEGIDKKYLVELFKAKNIPVLVVGKDRMYINFVNQHVEMAQAAISTEVPEIGEYLGESVYQVVAYVEKGQEDILKKQLSECKITRWNDYAVDIISAQGGKVAGIEQYLLKNGICREETMSFGDGENDIEMLRFAGIGVAMGNAEESVKKNADYITASVDEDGIEKALQHFKLI